MNGLVNVAVGYPKQDQLSVYELPYKGGAMAMDFLVPQGPLAALEASLTPARVNTVRPLPPILHGGLLPWGASTE